MKKLVIVLSLCFISFLFTACDKKATINEEENTNTKEIQQVENKIVERKKVETTEKTQVITDTQAEEVEEKTKQKKTETQKIKSKEQIACAKVEKDYMKKVQDNPEILINNMQSFELEDNSCILAYSYTAEGRHYWKVVKHSDDSELYSDECMPDYNVENDIMTYCTEDMLDEKQKKLEIYIEKELGRFKKATGENQTDIFSYIQKMESQAKIAGESRTYDTEVGIFSCTITETIKERKYTYCFDGGMQEREIYTYYDKKGYTKGAIFKINEMNASPAMEKYDENKTKTQKYTFVFGTDGYIGNIVKVYDSGNKEIELSPEITTEWNKFTEVIPVY